MKPEPCTDVIKLRVPHSWWERLELWAATERRKPTQLLRNIIQDALEDRQRGQSEAA
jgi:hypothetical protein